MYPREFDYYRAKTVAEAIALLEEHRFEETELLAGGHSLIPTMKTGLAAPDIVIDIGHIDELNGIVDDGGHFSIGALTNYDAVASSRPLRERTPAFAEAAAAVGDVQVRNRGTVGGNIAHADPASDLPGAALVSEAVIVVRGPDGERTVPADEFFMGMYMTDVQPDELLTHIELPALDAVGSGGAYVKRASPSSGFAIVGVAAVLEIADDTIRTARVAATGVLDHAVRLPAVERSLVGAAATPETIADAAEHADDSLDAALIMEDIHASGEFRQQLLNVYTERALESAAERADVGSRPNSR
ncbi:FAD binding domain-containing protein [Halomarina halobia]|uniref:FAD binding domain-containing protein n=1 Tax=Halomarina halobia TaxID=3033386 RepID=A0ABD6AFA8_9EURY|nr:xanthine dehydrogenase family protein subunit M [Halomarina sp. PSR21]